MFSQSPKERFQERLFAHDCPFSLFQIQHQYRLTKEDGPPHRKRFTVTLKLGDSEFEAEGTSIKKAQHEAAAIALRNTKYKHPPPKLLPNTRGKFYSIICQPLTRQGVELTVSRPLQCI